MMLPWNKPNLLEIWNWPFILLFKYYVFWWAKEIELSWLRKLLVPLSYFILSVNIWFTVANIIQIFVLMQDGNIAKIVSQIISCAPALIGLIKLLHFVLGKEQFKRIMRLMDDMMEDAVRSGIDPVLEAKIRHTFKRCWIITVVILGPGIMTNWHWGISPLVSLLNGGSKQSVISSWPDIQPESLGLFTLNRIYHAFNLVTIGFGIYSFDVIFACICELLILHFTITKHWLYKMDISNGPQLRKCIIHHQKIIKAAKMLAVFSEKVIISECALTTMILCCGIYHSTKAEHVTFAEAVEMLDLLVLILLTQYIYCYYSCEITNECGELANSAYFTDWENGEVENRMILRTFMARTMMPITFGGIFKVDLNTFVALSKAAFSYYNFLQAVEFTNRIAK